MRSIGSWLQAMGRRVVELAATADQAVSHGIALACSACTPCQNSSSMPALQTVDCKKQQGQCDQQAAPWVAPAGGGGGPAALP